MVDFVFEVLALVSWMRDLLHLYSVLLFACDHVSAYYSVFVLLVEHYYFVSYLHNLLFLFTNSAPLGRVGQ